MQAELDIEFERIPAMVESGQPDILENCANCWKENVECYSLLPFYDGKIAYSGEVLGFVCEKCHRENNGDEILEYRNRVANHQSLKGKWWMQEIYPTIYIGEKRTVLTEIFKPELNKK